MCSLLDDRGDRDLRRHVAGDTFADGAQPLLEEHVALGFVDRGGANVGRDLEHLLEPLLLVEALREAEPGARDARQRLGPAEQIGSGRGERRLRIAASYCRDVRDVRTARRRGRSRRPAASRRLPAGATCACARSGCADRARAAAARRSIPGPRRTRARSAPSSCSSVSTPSAVTRSPSACARPMTADTIAASPGSEPSPLTNERSIFTESTGNRFR